MTATLHFVGGPLDGRMIEWQDAPSSFHVPVFPPITFKETEPDLLPPHQTLVYVRRRGVVANEAVYDLSPSDPDGKIHPGAPA